jgi:hypothetical protein|tara:strand:+ start:350 stop:535 length:186 start_codon:yes stop_codon:yes gene_type:complete
MDDILVIYFSISAMSMFTTACYLANDNIDGIDSFWDWVIFNLFWIFHPLKAIVKFFKHLFK